MEESIFNEGETEQRYIEPCNKQCDFCCLNYVDALRANYLFKGIKADVITDLIGKIHHQVKSYHKGELLAYSGDTCNSLRIILAGSVVGEMVDFEGKSLRIETISAPNTVASAFMFGDNNQIPVNITALEDTKLLLISKQDLMALFRQNEMILNNYLDISSNRADLLAQRIRLLGLPSIRKKIAHYLLEQMRRQGHAEIAIKHSQAELADMFGITRSSLARVVREMHREGIIYANRRKIRIVNKDVLSRLL